MDWAVLWPLATLMKNGHATGKLMGQQAMRPGDAGKSRQMAMAGEDGSRCDGAEGRGGSGETTETDEPDEQQQRCPGLAGSQG